MPKIPLIAFLFLGLTLAPNHLKAQAYQQLIDYAQEQHDNKDYFGANDTYRQLMALDSLNPEILYHHAKNLNALNNPDHAAKYYYKAYLIDRGKTYPQLAFELAEAYRNSGQYRKSRSYYSKAIRPFRKNKKSPFYRIITQKKKAAAWASQQQKKEKDFELNPYPLSQNSGSAEFSGKNQFGFFTYTAMRADSVGPGNQVFDQEYRSELYSVKEGKAETKKVIVQPNPGKDMDLANLFLFEENIAFFSVCDTNGKCAIWKGDWNNGNIKNAKALNANINPEAHNNTQAQAFSLDGEEYLLFSSNRIRGFGGMDLWLSKKTDFGYEAAVNLGANINSLGDEISPYYNPKNKTLYFSSTHHLGYGGFDIFKAKGGPLQFEKLENLGTPYNSLSDDSYFFPFDHQALISSNRSLNNASGNSSCCNDLYLHPFEEDEYIENDPEKIDVDINVLNQYLPMDLYFHNDEPNPNTRDTSTLSNYMDLSRSYQTLKTDYLKNYLKTQADSLETEAELEIDQFFSEMEDGVKSLEFFLPLLLKELQKGSHISLNIKGYASSLSGSDYNLNLTLRRIESLINYMKAYEGGVLAPYLNASNTGGGQLSVHKMPFGEFANASEIDPKNKLLAIYSPEAARQRKIEIVAVTEDSDSVNASSTPKIAFSSNEVDIDISIDQLPVIKVKNEGSADLQIYAISANAKGIDCRFPKTLIPNAVGDILIELNPQELNGAKKIVLEIFSNTSPNINKITLRLN